MRIGRSFSFHWITFSVLLLSLVLLVVRPSFALLFQNTELGHQLKLDHGIPTTWYKFETDKRPTRSIIPENSIGLDYIHHDIYRRQVGLGVNLYRTVPGDLPFGKTYKHPPLIPLFFSWVLFFPPRISLAIWSFCILFVVWLSCFLWLKFSCKGLHPGESFWSNNLGLIFSTLFLISYPAAFAYERGNNDILILILISLMAWLFWKQKWLAFGILSSVASLMKIYPTVLSATIFLTGIFLLVMGLIRPSGLGSVILKIWTGQVMGAALVLLPLWSSYREYLFHVLPRFAAIEVQPSFSVFSHSLPVAFGMLGLVMFCVLWLIGSICFAVSLFYWMISGGSKTRKLAIISFAYLSGLMTYLANNSYDYNLILIIPLICILTSMNSKHQGIGFGLGLTCLLSGILLPRWINEAILLSGTLSIFMLLQALGWILIAWTLARKASDLVKSETRATAQAVSHQ